MREVMTKSMARNIFYGGSLFFILIFVGLTAHSHYYIVNTSTDKATLTESVAAGKHLWEKHACINCHTILGEGAAVVVISQDLDELLEVSDSFAVLNEGRLTKPRPTEGLTMDEIGLMMGGAHGMEVAHHVQA